MKIYSKPLLWCALKNLHIQHTNQSKGANFMYNYQFDNVISTQAEQILTTDTAQQESPVITELDPTYQEQIYNVGRSS